MKALQLVGVRDMRIGEVPEPQILGDDDVLVRVTATGICGSDLHYYRGETLGYGSLSLPFIMGHEFAGVVEAVGGRVTHLRPGDRVAVDPAISCGACEACLEGRPNVCPFGRFVGSPGVPGSLQERLVHPARLAFKLPDSVDDMQGAMLEPLGVALHALDLGGIRVGDQVAVLGCGPIGLLIIQLARLAGARGIFATDVLDHRRRMAEEHGATLAIDATRQDPVRAILEATNHRGADVVFEAAGAPEGPYQAVKMTKGGGTVVVVGIPAEDHLLVPATESRRKEVTIKVSRRMRHMYPRTIALVEQRMVRVDSLITHILPLDQGAHGFAILDAYAENVGKVVLRNE